MQDMSQNFLCDPFKNKCRGESKRGGNHPMYGRTGENHPMHGRTGEKHPMYGRTGEKHPMYGKKHLEETKKKMSVAKQGEKHPMHGRTGEKHPMYGKHRSEETKKKISVAMKGEKNPMYGKKNEKIKIICEICHVEFETRSYRKTRCDICQKEYEKEYQNEYQKEYKNEKYKTDSMFRLNSIISHNLRHNLKMLGSSKSELGNSCKKILNKYCNYSIEDLKNHLEKQFKPGMNWDNQGEWHIDHIIPIIYYVNMKKRFGLSVKASVKSTWKLENLQPMWGSENLSKNSKFNGKRHMGI